MVGPRLAYACITDRGYAYIILPREMGVSEPARADVMNLFWAQASAGAFRFEQRNRNVDGPVYRLVAGGRYELYSEYLVQIYAVAASVVVCP